MSRDGRRYSTPEEAFAARAVVMPSGCWEWSGSRNSKGYGQIRTPDGLEYAHRWAYERFIGPIPVGYVIDHEVCSNPSCCNPEHLAPATNGDNIWREQRERGTCKNGHPRTEHNVYIRPDNGKIGDCLDCRRERRAAA